MTYVVILFNAAVYAGVFPQTGEASKIVLMAGSVLASLGYTVARTAIKMSAARQDAFGSAAQGIVSMLGMPTRASQRGSVSTKLSGILAGGFIAGALLIGIAGNACTKTPVQNPMPGSGSGSASSGLLSCSEANLDAVIGDKPLWDVVVGDLLDGNYAAAIAALVGTAGANEVGCIVTQIADLEEAAAQGSGGAQLSPELAMRSVLGARARELATTYGWQRRTQNGGAATKTSNAQKKGK